MPEPVRTMTGGLQSASLFLPATDGGVYAQAVAATVMFVALAWASRHNRDLLSFVGGLAALTAAAMGLRALH